MPKHAGEVRYNVWELDHRLNRLSEGNVITIFLRRRVLTVRQSIDAEGLVSVSLGFNNICKSFIEVVLVAISHNAVDSLLGCSIEQALNLTIGYAEINAALVHSSGLFLLVAHQQY